MLWAKFCIVFMRCFTRNACDNANKHQESPEQYGTFKKQAVNMSRVQEMNYILNSLLVSAAYFILEKKNKQHYWKIYPVYVNFVLCLCCTKCIKAKVFCTYKWVHTLNTSSWHSTSKKTLCPNALLLLQKVQGIIFAPVFLNTGVLWCH